MNGYEYDISHSGIYNNSFTTGSSEMNAYLNGPFNKNIYKWVLYLNKF